MKSYYFKKNFDDGIEIYGYKSGEYFGKVYIWRKVCEKGYFIEMLCDEEGKYLGVEICKYEF